MTDKDPKDMTASELVRWVENYTDIDGKRPSDRYGVLNCSIAQGMDIARRQADLDARKGGE